MPEFFSLNDIKDLKENAVVEIKVNMAFILSNLAQEMKI